MGLFKESFMAKHIRVPAHVLASLIDMAKSHVEDIESGIEEGIYSASENTDLPDKVADVDAADKLYQAEAGRSSVKVRHWEAYQTEGTVDTHQFDIDDQRETSGQIYADIGSLEGNLDDLMATTMEVNTNPLNGIDHVPCVHVNFDGDNLAVSLFKVDGNILVRPERDVTIEGFQHSINGITETLFWIK